MKKAEIFTLIAVILIVGGTALVFHQVKNTQDTIEVSPSIVSVTPVPKKASKTKATPSPSPSSTATATPKVTN